MPIQQSGNITPGHLAIWLATGVIGDGGALRTQEQVLGSLNASFNDTNDQPIPVSRAITVFVITRILVTNASTSLTTAVGGFYSGASKTGVTVVAASQVYTFNTAASIVNFPTLTAGGSGTRFSAANLETIDDDYWALYLSLTTGQGTAATADVFLCGFDLSAGT